MEIEKKYTTTLETLAHDVGSILDYKLKATNPQAVADYVAFAVENLTQNVERAKQAKADLTAYIKENTSAIETVKEGTAKWLKDNGIDKLEGMRICSLTSYTPIEEKAFEVLNDEFFLKLGFKIVTTIVDVAKSKAWVEKQLKEKNVDMELFTETFGKVCELETTHKQPVIKINKRKK